MTDSLIRTKIGAMFQSPQFCLSVANLGKSPDKMIAADDWGKVALSLPRFYAVVEAAEIVVSIGTAPDLNRAFELIANGGSADVDNVANRCARLAWQSQQPLISQDRISRPIIGCTSGNLPDGELQKDQDRVRATAAFLLEKLAEE